MKLIEIVLRRGKREDRERWRVNITKMYFKHTCKYHNIFPLQLLYANLKRTLKKKLT
jgi:hypothetical protein